MTGLRRGASNRASCAFQGALVKGGRHE